MAGRNCEDTDLFRNATAWESEDDPDSLSESDPNAGELPMYGYCSNDRDSDEDSMGSLVEMPDVRSMALLLVGWWFVFF